MSQKTRRKVSFAVCAETRDDSSCVRCAWSDNNVQWRV